jgi:hypothetical protein
MKKSEEWAMLSAVSATLGIISLYFWNLFNGLESEGISRSLIPVMLYFGIFLFITAIISGAFSLHLRRRGPTRRQKWKKRGKLLGNKKLKIALLGLLIVCLIIAPFFIYRGLKTVMDKPKAAFNYTGNLRAYKNVQFTDDSTDSYGTISSWSWNFGDSVSSDVENPAHSYSENGAYWVRLTVTNDVGKSNTCVKYIEILPWLGENGESLDEFVHVSTATINVDIVDTAGNAMILHNNPYAKDPTWDTLMSFLQQDNTDLIPYNSSSFVCADYAENLHNNAEKAGIRAAYVVVHTSTDLHALDAFRTTDRGLVFIDDTGVSLSEQIAGTRYAKQVNIVVGEQYVPTFLFLSGVTGASLGTVDFCYIQW